MAKKKDTVTHEFRWAEVVWALGGLATQAGVPILKTSGDMDEIDAFCARLKDFRREELELYQRMSAK